MGKNKLTSTNKVINSELSNRQDRRKKKKVSTRNIIIEKKKKKKDTINMLGHKFKFSQIFWMF